MLFNLCGVSAVHVGGDYESASRENRSLVQSSRVDFPVDILAWSTWSSVGDILYVCQCAIAGKGQTIITKINDIRSAFDESDVILAAHERRPIIYPAVVTSMKKADLRYEYREAEEKSVKIIAVEDLLYLLQAIRNKDLAITDELHKMLTTHSYASVEAHT